MPAKLSPAFLPDIQGNILQPFRKDRFLYLFARFGGKDGARRWLRDIVTHPDFATAHRMSEELTWPTWLAVAFTHSGLTTLNGDRARESDVFTEFREGAAGRTYTDGGPPTLAALVGDPAARDPAGWVVGHPERSPVDVVLTVAADEAVFEDIARREQQRATAHGLHVLVLDQGRASPTSGQRAGRLGGGIDHFGFRDGISQPGIRGFTEEVIRNRRLEDARQPGSPIIAAGEFVLGYDAEPRFYAPSGTSRPKAPEWMHNGSFQVLLRLTQDVEGWRSQMASLRSFAATSDVIEGAVGRKRSGAPLARAGAADNDNDFTYEDDPDGRTTPLHAHIRAMNPRNDDVHHDCQHRMLRRGTSFGPPVEGDAGDGVARGIMFNAFMASIKEQFEYVQRRWANPFPSPQAPAGAVPDALIGAGSSIRVQQHDGKGVKTVEVPFRSLVRTSGAVYAFAPSLDALHMLGGA
jgi:Dyp-type peroxidase family